MAGASYGSFHIFPGDLTIVLVGSTGSGKSATGNSILEKKAFKSSSAFGRVTTTSMRQATVLEDGRVFNVIDTPGLFDSISKPEDVEKEIVRSIQMSKDGIHAVLLVVSLKVRFSEEQVATVETLKHLFGNKILDYMIVTFTGGDELEEDQTLDDYLAYSCPPALKDLLEKCEERKLVFNNRAKDQVTKAEQRRQLLTLITNILVKNGGKPYTHELFNQLKNETAERDSKKKIDEEQQLIATMVKEKLKEREEETTRLKQEAERLKKELNASTKHQQRSKQEMQRLNQQLPSPEGNASLFGSTIKREDVEKESARCMEMAKDGIHALLLVVSLKVRFNEEQVAIVETLTHMFGDRILDYMIVAFTGGDELEDDQTLDEYLACSRPPALKDLLEKCGNRKVVFNNRAKDKETKAEQRQQLLTVITNILVKNSGKPYTHQLVVKMENSNLETDKASEDEELQGDSAEVVVPSNFSPKDLYSGASPLVIDSDDEQVPGKKQATKVKKTKKRNILRCSWKPIDEELGKKNKNEQPPSDKVVSTTTSTREQIGEKTKLLLPQEVTLGGKGTAITFFDPPIVDCVELEQKALAMSTSECLMQVNVVMINFLSQIRDLNTEVKKLRDEKKFSEDYHQKQQQLLNSREEEIEQLKKDYNAIDEKLKASMNSHISKEDLYKWLVTFLYRIMATAGMVEKVKTVNLPSFNYGCHFVAVVVLERLAIGKEITAKWIKQFIKEAPRKTMHQTLVRELTQPEESQFPLLEIIKDALPSMKEPEELTKLAGDVSVDLTSLPPEELSLFEVSNEKEATQVEEEYEEEVEEEGDI
ncbi:OLC1v1015905C1 [Oldenlandia corymbosa var. corymbosa]|uniref:OLC1v1015905C1 n=1 Tax=Oldenlandia corymbosa var. corymbosa TaxID=529605 RepID=A0AAV1E4A6_OLDCO|nr:OLC1v1015905C1 [Oldenlandia corymbosa var. corymbosa]